MDYTETVRAAGLEDRDIQTVSNCHERICGLLPSKEVPTGLFISQLGKASQAELYFFTESFLIHILGFQKLSIHREIKFSVYPLKDSVRSLQVDSKEEFREAPVTLSIDIKMTEDTFTFTGEGKNSVKLKRILEEVLYPNLKNG
jgi:hypothetical protein